MKKTLAIAAIISAFSLNCAADLFEESVSVKINNDSGIDEVRVTGKNGGDITVDNGNSETCTFRLREQRSSFPIPSVALPHKTTLKVSAGNDSVTFNIEGQEDKTLVIRPGLECELDGKIVASSKRRHKKRRDEDGGQDRGRKSKKMKRHIKQDEDQE